MASVTYDKASRIYPGAERPAVDALDLEITDGEFLVLIGPSGCGELTSLRMLAGLEEVNNGQIRIGDRDVTHLKPKDRDIADAFTAGLLAAMERNEFLAAPNRSALAALGPETLATVIDEAALVAEGPLARAE